MPPITQSPTTTKPCCSPNDPISFPSLRLLLEPGEIYEITARGGLNGNSTRVRCADFVYRGLARGFEAMPLYMFRSVTGGYSVALTEYQMRTSFWIKRKGNANSTGGETKDAGSSGNTVKGVRGKCGPYRRKIGAEG